MGRTTRRGFLGAAAALPAAASVQARPVLTAVEAVEHDLRRYVGFGSKQSGGPGDTGCGEWLEAELRKAGFATERQSISVPFFDPRDCALATGSHHAPLWPQPIVVPTPPEGLTAPLVRIAADGTPIAPVRDAIALFELPHGRWSSALTKGIRGPIEAAFGAGALAVVAITSGPTGKIIALNTDGRKPMFTGRVALMAPEDAGPFLAAARQNERATLRFSGDGGRRPAFNLIGRLDRGRRRWLVVSTPRSGWFTCAAERGGGIAAWLRIARWAGAALPAFDLAFICNSGHEYEYLGAEAMLREIAPRPDSTAFWLHLGANLAARDWHEAVGSLRPLPGTDSQRYLVVSQTLLEAARREFAGLAGLERPYASHELSAGELTNVIAAGYPLVAGVFGTHRFHHVSDDDARCLDAAAVARTAAAFQRLVEHAATA